MSRLRRLIPLALTAIPLISCGGDPSWLIDQLQSHNPAVRQDAVIDASGFDHPEITAMLESMLSDPDGRIRLAVVNALDIHGATSSVRPIIAHVHDPDPEVAKAAIDTLGRLKDPTSAPALMSVILVNFEEPPLNAIWALGEIGAHEAIPLLSRLRNHHDIWVQHNTTEALRELK